VYQETNLSNILLALQPQLYKTEICYKQLPKFYIR